MHKFPRWKQFLKGFYDSYADRVRILVTGSSRLAPYRRVGDSLMGRYVLYHMHPLSVAEIIHRALPDFDRIVRPPKKLNASDFNALWEHGGYPEPFLKRDRRFSRRWQRLRTEQLLREDLRDLTQIQHVDQIGMLARLLASRSGSQVNFSNLARSVQVSVDTIRRWVETLNNLHHGFLVRPWFKNVSRSLRKEPKWLLRDWAEIEGYFEKFKFGYRVGFSLSGKEQKMVHVGNGTAVRRYSDYIGYGFSLSFSRLVRSVVRSFCISG